MLLQGGADRFREQSLAVRYEGTNGLPEGAVIEAATVR